MRKQNLLSGIAPSGQLTLGNYLGAIQNWIERQHQYNCFFPLSICMQLLCVKTRSCLPTAAVISSRST